MKILIDNSGYELKNIGDTAMLIVALSRIEDLISSPMIYVITANPTKLSELFPKAVAVCPEGRKLWRQKRNIVGALHWIVPNKFEHYLYAFEDWMRSTFPDFTLTLINHRLNKRGQRTELINQYIDIIKNSDCVIATGGGFITDAFQDHAENVLSTLEFAQKLGKPTAMFGQGLGPISNNNASKLAKRVFCNLSFLGIRESIYSKDVALKLNCDPKKIVITGDDAIELPLNTLNKHKTTNSIGVNLRVAEYSKLDSKTFLLIRDVILKESEILGAELIPIPISSHDGDSDIKAISNFLDKNLTIEEYDTPEKIIQLISKCRIVITGSYHAGVFALSMGIPVVGIVTSEYYKQKFEGLQNQFKSACYIVEVADVKDKDTLSSATLAAWNLSDVDKENLKLNAKKQLIQSEKLYQEFFNKMKPLCPKCQ